MDDFVLVREQVVDLLRLLAGAVKRTAGARAVVHRARVVVAELHDHHVAFAELREHRVPVPLADERAAAAAA